jgi:hypothetical protein
VHLVTRLLASPRNHLADATGQVSPDHFQAFIAQVLEPLRREALAFQWRHRTLPTSIPSQDPRAAHVVQLHFGELDEADEALGETARFFMRHLS